MATETVPTYDFYANRQYVTEEVSTGYTVTHYGAGLANESYNDSPLIFDTADMLDSVAQAAAFVRGES